MDAASMQAEFLADDLELPEEATAWMEEDAVAYFESGGTLLPRPVGLGAMELHTYYDMKRHEALGSSSVMLTALKKVFQGTGRDDALNSTKPPDALPPATLPGFRLASSDSNSVAHDSNDAGKPTDEAATSTGEESTSTGEAVFPLFLNGLGLGGFRESLSCALVDQGEGEGVHGLAQWHARDAKQFQALLAQVGMKLGQRQRLVAALLKEAVRDMD
uniref:Uncharacterized protein n=1 Tax=Chrysotila carterae TaxID=13221 RepID=A0A7S4C102_CHRCT|eukprot:6173674-Pleurochrysis_carterae.AAC.1